MTQPTSNKCMTQWKKLDSFCETVMTKQDGRGWVAGLTLAAYLNTTSYLNIRTLWLTELR